MVFACHKRVLWQKDLSSKFREVIIEKAVGTETLNFIVYGT